MIFYFQTKFTASVVGARIVGVDCEKCGCRYYFELRRTGIGTGVAPYSVGTSGANEAAKQNAKADTEERLGGEAELVPCPKCHWVNEDLVRGYRQSCYRGYVGLAVTGAIISMAACLIMSWVIWKGPQLDHGALRYLLIYFPLGIVGLVISFRMFIGWLRSRIQPNQNFPLTPNVPRGTPQALIVSAAGGLIPANSAAQFTDDDSFDFQIGKHRFPSACCCCLESSNFEYVLTLKALPGTELQIPICSSCGTQSARYRTRIGRIVGVAIFIASVVVLLIMGLKDDAFWILAGASIVVSATIGGFACHNAVHPVWITATDQMRGVIRLRFQNPDYRSQIVEIHDVHEL